MAHHHGMNQLKGLHAFCHYGHVGAPGDRFGRMFALPPLYVKPDGLRKLGAQGGPMDGGTGSDRTQSVPVGHIFFGQFVDHDITLDVTSSLSAVAEPLDIPNVRTPTLDLDCIYGLGPEAQPYLYHGSGDFAGVKLLTGADGTAAQVDQGGSPAPQPAALAAEDLARSAHGAALIGDPRNDENRVISQLQLAVIRLHNKTVDDLAAGGLHDHLLFEAARQRVTWHYQWVVVEDFLRALCGNAVVDDILGNGRRFYCPYGQGVPYIPVEFSVAAYRFGHSMIPQRIQIQKNGSSFEVFGTTLGRGFTPLSDEDAVVDWHELTTTSENRQVQNAEQLDTKLATDLLKLPFIPPTSEQSLATRNLLRGQAFQLPSGEQIARAMGREEAEIDGVTQAAQTIAGSDVDLASGTPLWFYLLTEAETLGRETQSGQFEAGEGLGPVGARIVAETLIGLVELDPHSYLATNRNWGPQDGAGVETLGELLTY